MRRSHVELRSHDVCAPRQYVSDTHNKKRTYKPKPIREFNAMTLKLLAFRKEMHRAPINRGD